MRLLLLLVAACGAQPVGRAEALAINGALARAGAACAGDVRVEVLDEPAPGGFDGWAEWRGGDATLRLSSAEPYVVAHELGHAMGLAHEADAGSVMHSPAARASLPEAAEQIARLCAYRGPCRCPALR